MLSDVYDFKPHKDFKLYLKEYDYCLKEYDYQLNPLNFNNSTLLNSTLLSEIDSRIAALQVLRRRLVEFERERQQIRLLANTLL